MVSCLFAYYQDATFAALTKKWQIASFQGQSSPEGPSEASPRLLDPDPTWTWRLRSPAGPNSTISTSPSKPPTNVSATADTTSLGDKGCVSQISRCDRKTARSNGLPVNNPPFSQFGGGNNPPFRSCSTRSEDGKMGRDQDIRMWRLFRTKLSTNDRALINNVYIICRLVLMPK